MNSRSIATLCGTAILAACQDSPVPVAPAVAVTSIVIPYEIVDLGTLGGAFAMADQINALGHVAGRSQNTAGEYRAFLWDGSVMQDLGPVIFNCGRCGDRVRLNDNDQVAWTGPTTDGSTHAFLWDNGAVTDLGTLGGTFSRAAALNNLGQVVGTSAVDSTSSHAFLWQDGVMTDLGTLGGASSGATAINDNGQIVGTSTLAAGSSLEHAFLWQDGAMTDLGSLGGRSSAVAINKAGWIVGESWTGTSWPPSYAVLWRGGEMINLGTLPGDLFSTSVAVNAHGEIAGISYKYDSGDYRDPFVWKARVLMPLDPAYPRHYWQHVAAMNDDGVVVGHRYVNSHAHQGTVWEADGVGQDLGTLGGEQSDAIDINTSGMLVGWASTESGETHAVLWRPGRIAPPVVAANR
ncbi:MAG TPA: hypothetical protein VGQ06_09225 [Gemmatimonadales bacterium]|jgi:probable HAF family extracellular repeat protein|nr:hypothetical protein [Gemmatimonadales bacterium]